MIWSLQHQSVSTSSSCCCCWGFTFVLLRLIRPSSVCLGLVRLGPQTQWPTFTAADCGCCSRNLPFTANLDPPSLGSSGIHNSSYRSRTFSYLFSQICGIFPCPDFFLLLVPPPLLLCRFFSSAVFPFFLSLPSSSSSVSSRADLSADSESVHHEKHRGAQRAHSTLSTTLQSCSKHTLTRQALELAVVRSLSVAKSKNATSGENDFPNKCLEEQFLTTL